MTYRYIGDGKAIVTLRNGLHLAVPMHDPFIGAAIALNLELEPLLDRTIAERVRAGMRCINVGANVGYFATLLGRSCQPGGQVFCFEPNPRNVELLVYNLCLNQLNHCAHIYRAAVARSGGTARFVVPRDYSDGWIAPADYAAQAASPRFEASGLYRWEGAIYRNSELHEVPMVTLDHVLGDARAFDILLCDAEGFDVEVLMGAERVIANSPDLLMIFEWNANRFDAQFERVRRDEVFAMLRRHGYRTAYARDGAWVPFDAWNDGVTFEDGNILCER